MSYKLSSSSSNNSNSMPPLRLTGLYQGPPVAPLDLAHITERIETAPLSHTRNPKAYPVVREDFLPRSVLTAKPLMGTSSHTVGEWTMLPRRHWLRLVSLTSRKPLLLVIFFPQIYRWKLKLLIWWPFREDSKESEDNLVVVATARGVFDSNGGVLESKETGMFQTVWCLCLSFQSPNWHAKTESLNYGANNIIVKIHLFQGNLKHTCKRYSKLCSLINVTGVSIVIPKDAIPEGVQQEIYFKVCEDNSIVDVPLDKEKGVVPWHSSWRKLWIKESC